MRPPLQRQSQVDALPATSDLTSYVLAADLAAVESLNAANASGLTLDYKNAHNWSFVS